MISLPNNCERSEIRVNPANWNTKRASMVKAWFIHYRFYDRNTGKSRQISIRGMNTFRSLEERQQATRELIKREKELLDSGFNMISMQMGAEQDNSGQISPATLTKDALTIALQYLSCEPSTFKSAESSIKVMQEYPAIMLMPAGQILPKHILQLLNAVEKDRGLSASNYNHYRSYLMMCFKKLFLLGAVNIDPVSPVPKRKVTKRLPDLLTTEERKKIGKHLRENFYVQWRYMNIFFHSGARTTELMRVKREHVDLSKQRYRTVVKKRGQPVEVEKMIKDIVLPLWEEVCREAKPGHYLFGSALHPGQAPGDPGYIAKFWKKVVQDGLGIKKTFYPLKHLHTTEVMDILEDETQIAAHNSHTSTAMVVNIYDTKNRSRKEGKVKGLRNEF